MHCFAGVLPVQTNIIIAELGAGMRASDMLTLMAAGRVRGLPFGPSTLRFVTHLDVTDEDVQQAIRVMSELRP
jgi:threonine aldolase